MTNMNNTQKANEINFPTNGNCKKVKNLTTNTDYNSVTEAAILNKVTLQVMSRAINRKKPVNGCMFEFVKDLSVESLCEENAKANARAIKAEAKLSEMDELRAKAKAYDQLMAEQERKRKEEEARLERERKAEEKRQAKITKLENKVERLETLIDRNDKERQKLTSKRNKALAELQALNDGKEE